MFLDLHFIIYYINHKPEAEHVTHVDLDQPFIRIL